MLAGSCRPDSHAWPGALTHQPDERCECGAKTWDNLGQGQGQPQKASGDPDTAERLSMDDLRTAWKDAYGTLPPPSLTVEMLRVGRVTTPTTPRTPPSEKRAIATDSATPARPVIPTSTRLIVLDDSAA